MISLTVVSYNGAAPEAGLQADFDEIGGTIGRADNNQLVLPDPDRTISRVHAQLVFRSGGYAIVDRGSNPISVNDRPVGNGHEAPLKDGDRVQIGGYLLAVRQTPSAPAGGRAASTVDPFGDLLGAPTPTLSGGRARAGAAAAPFDDPFAAFGSAAPVADTQGWQQLPPSSTGRAPAPAPAAGGIPDDWDPFAPDTPPARKGPAPDLSRSLGLEVGASAPPPLIPGFGGGGGGGNDNSIDQLFGLKPGLGDPLANSVLNEAAAKPNMASNADPMRSLNSAPKATSQSEGDALSDLQRPFVSRQAVAAPAVPSPGDAPAPAAVPKSAPGWVPPSAPPQTAPERRPAPASEPLQTPAAAPGRNPAPPATGQLPSGAVLSWHDPSADGHTVIRPPTRTTGPAGLAGGPQPVAGGAGSTPAPVPARPSVAPPPAAGAGGPATAAPILATPLPAVPAPASPASPGSLASPAPRSPAPASADVAALLAAFRDGLATPSLQIEALTPELMNLVGQLLRESAQGTIDLLVARAAMKREVRAEQTMIVARENNPLKFSPSAEAALGHLLAPPTRGFMAAGPAMRDAYADLRAHQFGFVAGLRAALEGVLERFDPARLEGQLTQRSVLQSLLPGSRKARMWEMFNDMYGQIRNEAADDFHTLFGKAFLKAYEEHVAELSARDAGSRSP